MSAEAHDATPFLKWAGSKRWLVPKFRRIQLDPYHRYFEPFLGSGAMFFGHGSMRPSVLADTIPPLVHCYQMVRDSPDAVAETTRKWSVDKATYYEVRNLRTNDPVIQAARFIYLNKTCFNGLYRVNNKGEFNVPFGRPKSERILDGSALLKASRALSQPGVTLVTSDFEDVLQDARLGDFVYVDPPYMTGHLSNGFVDYNEKLFSWRDQERLAEACQRAMHRGAHILISNADHHTVRDLYSYYGFSFIPTSRHSSMASRVNFRGPRQELLISDKSILRVISDAQP